MLEEFKNIDWATINAEDLKKLLVALIAVAGIASITALLAMLNPASLAAITAIIGFAALCKILNDGSVTNKTPCLN